MATENRFRLVGYRFARLMVDESPLVAHVGDSANLELSSTSAQPVLSDQKFDDRPVIELKIAVDVRISADEKDRHELQALDVISAVAIAGFVGSNEKDDGNIELFAAESKDYSRPMYWLVRQRVQSLLAITHLRQFSLPWEPVDFENDVGTASTKRRPAKKNRKKPK